MAVYRAIAIGLVVLLALNVCEATETVCQTDKAPKKPKVQRPIVENTSAQVKWEPPTQTANSGCFSYAEYQWVVGGANTTPSPGDWLKAESDELSYVACIPYDSKAKVTFFMRSVNKPAIAGPAAPNYSAFAKKRFTVTRGPEPGN